MYHFCTYFDSGYLARGLALYRSLVTHCRPFRLWALCLDDRSFAALSRLNLAHCRPISLAEFEEADPPLRLAKNNRSPVEYYFTCTPSLPLFVLQRDPEVGLITYLDADLFFFANPAAVYEEIGAHSVAMFEHRYPPERRRSLEPYGKYNVGWLSFRRDAEGLRCLRWWRERCLEWCYDRLEDGRFADQKYLDDWPSRFRNVMVLRHKGGNVAPWNLANYKIRVRGKRVWVDDVPLVFFHFHGLRQLHGWVYDPKFVLYRVRPSAQVVRNIYVPYIKALPEAASQVPEIGGRPWGVASRTLGLRDAAADAPGWQQWVQRARKVLAVIRGLYHGKYIIVPRMPRMTRHGV